MTQPWLWHGGGLRAAQARFGGDDWLDLSTGINPQPWPADGIPIDWRRLPETEDLRELEEAAADHFGAHPEHVCAVPGTEIGLRLIGEILPGPARYLAPSYRTHAAMFGGAAPSVGLDGDGTLVLANPNNPDGRVIDPAALREHQGWLMVDEAFADCDPAIGLAGEVRDDRQVAIFRSFGKFFGLAGLRLGFVVAPRPVIARLRDLLGAWPVSAAALAIGTRAYRDEAWITASRLRLFEQATALDGVLARHGYEAVGACPLFRLIDAPQAPALFAHLARNAILTRPFDYAPTWLRLGLPGSAEALARLDAALADA